MDEIVRRAMVRWPDAPDVYGWLRLDARGNWRLKSPATQTFDLIGNTALREFIGRNYLGDERGRWFFQNGPQRVFVGLERAPLVFRIEGKALVDHCGRRVDRLDGLWLDEDQNVYGASEHGPGSLDDRDLMSFSDGLADVTGVADSALASVWESAYGRILLRRVTREDLGGILGFQREPTA